MSERTKIPKRPSLKTRVHGLYSGMVLRHGPKLWKSGKRKGTERVPGIELPFSESELLAGMERAFPDESVRSCPYCSAPIDAFTATLDHEIPLTRGGSLGMGNIGAICATCNRLKGGLTPGEFKSLLLWMEKQHPAARADIEQRLKAGAMGMRLRYFGKKAG